MDPIWLCSAPGAAAIAEAVGADAQHPGDPLAAAATLRRRHPELSPDQAATALEQASLRRTARDRHGLDAEGVLLTRDGLEQATRPVVARRRARALAGAGVRRVLDLTGGLGLDDRAFVAEGLDVTAVERDPTIAALLAHNLPTGTVVAADSTDPHVQLPLLAELAPTDVVFVDPARRAHGGPRDASTGRARPERDPERWSPPWSFVASLDHPRIVVKAAPGFDPPPGWRGQWTSVDRTLVECMAVSWPLFSAERRAVVLRGDQEATVDATTATLPVARQLGRWLCEPDPAVTAAAAESALAAGQPDLARLGDLSRWLTCDEEPSSETLASLRAYRVVEVLLGNTKEQRRRLSDLGVKRLVVKSRDVKRDPRQVLSELRCAEGGETTLILTYQEGRSVSVLAEPRPR